MLSPLRTAYGTDHDFVVVKINNIEREANIMKTSHD